MIDDGYGDLPSETERRAQEDLEMLLAAHEKPLRKLVGSFRVRDAHEYEELLQEARIALWRDLMAGERQTSHLMTAAKDRLLSLRSGDKPLLGSEKRTATESRRTEGGYARGRETRGRMAEFIQEFTHEHGRPPMQREIAAAVGISDAAVRKHLAKMHEPSEPKPFTTTSYDDLFADTADHQERAPRAARRTYDWSLAAHHGEIADAINSLDPADRAFVVHRFWADQPVPAIAQALGRPTSTLEGRWVGIIRPELRERLVHLAGVA